MNMKKILSLIVAGLALASCTMNNLGEATKTFSELSDNLYFAEIKGDDGFEGFLEQGGAISSEGVAKYLDGFLGRGPFGKTKVTISPVAGACTAFQAKHPDGHYVTGRNFDWNRCQILILRDKPEGGYASISTSNLDFLGFETGFKPEGMKNQIRALAAVFVPQDGMNEKGLVVADLAAGDNESTNQSTGKTDLTTSTAIRLLLNQASDVEESLELLRQYDMHSDIDKAHHLFISDINGHSVVVEWQSNEMLVKEVDALTNHYMCGRSEGHGDDSHLHSHQRLEKVLKALEAAGGVLNADQARDLLKDAQESDTEWSIVYDQTKAGVLSEKFYLRKNFNSGWTYTVK